MDMQFPPAAAASRDVETYPVGSASVNLRAKLARFLLGSATAAIALAVIALLTFHAYIAWVIARPYVAPLNSNPEDAVGIPYETVQFPSSNGKTVLDGWFLPADSDRTVIFSHGYGGNREEFWVPLYDLAKALHKRNYNVLMFDYGFVQPGGHVTGGVQESRELLGAIDYAEKRGSRHTYIWGFSMGAGTALQTALLGPKIDGMILDSTFLLDPDTLYQNIRQVVDLPRFPSIPLIRLFFPVLNGVSLSQIPYQQVKSTTFPMPIFFIHGEEDHKAPYEITEMLYDNQKANPYSELWLLPQGHHELIYQEQPRQYLEKTLDFLKRIGLAVNAHS